jgi:hypothetical protein
MPQGADERVAAGRSIGEPLVSGTLPLSVFVFVQRKEPAEDGSGFGIGQVDMAQIPERRPQAQALEMVVAGRDLKTDTLQTDGAVGAAFAYDPFRP